MTSGKALKNNIPVQKAVSVCALLLLLIAAVVITVIYTIPPKIYINEICTANDGSYPASGTVKDLNDNLCDWIELYNPTDKDISLKGFSLRKNGGEQFPLGDYTLKAGDYILVYCSKNGIEQDVPHVDFSVGKAEDSQISLEYGFVTCETISVCKMQKGCSYSRNEKGEMFVTKPTPLEANSREEIGDTPVFSKESGFYAEEFELEIYAGEGQTIYYTLDGSDPTKSETRIEYTGAVSITDRNGEPNTLSAYDPMKIQLDYREGKVTAPEDEDVDKGTVIRACAMGKSGEYGKISTAAYFVGLTTADHNDLPVISVVTDPDNLYDEETGIYCRGNVYEEYYAEHPDHYYNGSIPANYNQKGREWERECYIEFFESDGSLKLSQDAGMRIQGGWSRADYQKSFRFYARGSYGKDSFDYAFWEDLTDHSGNIMDSFKTIVLRNGGNDANYSKFKDIMLQDMVSQRDISTQKGRACILFIDGEYWGLYTLQEDYSEEYFASHYGVAESEVAIYKNGELDTGYVSDLEDFNEMHDLITQNDMSIDENYRKASTMLDMESFADYIATECYIFNDDWPQNNYGCWKTRTVMTDNEYSDGRWRFFLFDTESSAYHYNFNTDETDIFTYLEAKSNTVLGSMIISLLENDEFRMMFLTDLMDMGNICFDYGTYKQYLADYKSVYYEEMKSYFKRFPIYRTVENSTDPMIDRMTSFIFSRQNKLLKTLEKRYDDLSPRRTVSVRAENNESGYMLVNGCKVRSDFSGTYYDGCEITVTAVQSEGYIFVGWEISGEEVKTFDTEITVTVDGNLSVKAVFEKSIL